MKDSQVPLHGDRDGHEDTAGEEDIVEGEKGISSLARLYWRAGVLGLLE